MEEIIESNRASALLAKLGRGSLDADFARAVTRVCQAVAETGGKGSITLKIKVENNKDSDGGGIRIQPQVIENAPRHGLPSTSLHLQDDGTLLTQQEWLWSGPDERRATPAPLPGPIAASPPATTPKAPLADRPRPAPLAGNSADEEANHEDEDMFT